MRILLFLCIISFSISLNGQLQYPFTRRTDSADNYFGTKITDPYRWLEDDNSDETKAWVKEENKVSLGFLEKIPFREDFKKR